VEEEESESGKPANIRKMTAKADLHLTDLRLSIWRIFRKDMIQEEAEEGGVLEVVHKV